MLALRLLSLIRDATINKLMEKRDDILHVCKSSGARQLARIKLYAESKVISKAKLERTQAALEVDRQLIQQVNELIGESPSIVTKLTTSLMLPPELSELISTYTKLYKTSEAEAMSRFDTYVQSLHDERVVIEDLMQEIELKGQN